MSRRPAKSEGSRQDLAVPQADELADDSPYPAVERFVEHSSNQDVQELFAEVRTALEGLKGPNVAKGQKALVAIERTEELLLHLLEVRERILTSSKASRK